MKIKVVLVKTLYDRNIGSTSRVMNNMGVDELILVAPQCEVTYEAQLAAATGQTALQKRKTYLDWNDFYKHEHEGVRIAFTARDGRGRLVQDFDTQLKSYLEQIQSKEAEPPQNMYLIFGPEDAGLASEDMENTHLAVSLPTYGDNASFNLSHAVLMGLFILRQNIGGQRTLLDGSQLEKKTQSEPISLIGETMKEWLTVLGLNLESHKVNAHSVLYRMLLRTVPTSKEYQTLETMLQQTIRKLKRLKELENKTSKAD
ncbi:MAG: TrmH family RNA methyltransferase [Bdellovibrionaceae bacterium]|nr:TrmH family RNA methyltransferase [Pseudobdellovibrionaceae bacterium]